MATITVPRERSAEAATSRAARARVGDASAGGERARRVGLFVAVLLLAFGLRVFRLGAQSLWYDEAFSVFVVNRSWLAMAQFMASIVDNHPPLYYAILHVFLVAGGSSEYALRFASVVSGTLCIPLTLVLVRRVASSWARRGRAVAVGSTALLLAWSPVLIWYAQETRMYCQSAAFGLGGSLCLGTLLERQRRREPVLWPAVGLAACDLAALYSHIFSALVVAAQALVAAAYLVAPVAAGLRARSPGATLRPVAPLAASFLAIAAGFAPWAWFTLVRLGADQSYFGGTLPLHLFVHDVAYLLAGGDTPQPFLQGVFVAGGLLVVLGVVAAAGSRSSSGAARWLVPACALLPAVLLYALSRGHPKFSSRYLLVAAPYWYALAGLGLAWLASPRRRPLAVALPALCAGALAFLLVANVLDLRRVWSGEVARDDWRAAVAYIRANGGERDPILLVSGHAYPALLYYAPWAHWAGLPPDATLTTAHTITFGDAAALNRLVGSASRLWVVRWQDDVVDPDGVVKALLEQRGHEIVQGRYFHGVDVQGYGLAPGAFSSTPERTAIYFSFGRDVRLEGSDAEKAVWHAPSGGALSLTLYWRALATVPTDYRLSLRLRDSAGNEWGAFDGRPGGEFNPVTRWLPDQTVAGRVLIPITPGTPPGRYTLEAALYDPTTPQLTRLAVRDAQGRGAGDAAAIGTVVVEPRTPPLGARDVKPQVSVSGRSGSGNLLGLAAPLPGSVAPGESVPLPMYWQARGDVASRPGFLVHLTDSRGRSFDEETAPPADGSTVAPAWRAGDVVLWQVAPTVPAQAAPGPARVQVALVADGAPGELVDVGRVDVAARPEARETAPPSRTLAARFADGVELRGYDTEPARTAAPGLPLTVSLHWSASATPSRRWTVFVHALGPDGRIAAQHDGEPVSGRVPTTAWLAGDTILDSHTLTIPASLAGQSVTLEVGLYDPATGRRDPNLGGGDSVILGQVPVGR